MANQREQSNSSKIEIAQLKEESDNLKKELAETKELHRKMAEEMRQLREQFGESLEMRVIPRAHDNEEEQSISRSEEHISKETLKRPSNSLGNSYSWRLSMASIKNEQIGTL